MAPSLEGQVNFVLPPTAPASAATMGALPENPTSSEAALREHAYSLTQQWQTQPGAQTQTGFQQYRDELKQRLKERLRICSINASPEKMTPQMELLESKRMLEAAVATDDDVRTWARLPHTHAGGDRELPRVMALAEGYISAAGGIWSHGSLEIYVQQVQQHDPLLLDEVLALPVALKLAQLKFTLDLADEVFAPHDLPPIEQSPFPATPFSATIHSLRRLNQAEWRTLLEPLIAFDPILRSDPVGAFADMDDGTRNIYRVRVAELSRHADSSEVETAQIALDLAREASRVTHPDPRYIRRISHIGYYLFAEGLPQLSRSIGYHPPPIERARQFLRRWNEDFYILGIFILSLAIIVALIAPLVPHHAFWPVMGALLLALLPATQGAVDLVNNSVLTLLKAEPLPKLDFSKAVPESATTIVVVPTLLLSEKQVRELFDQLEARYLANQDKNIHFGLLTDLPDTTTSPLAETHNPLVQLAIQRTNELNTKYAGKKGGSFVLLHRYRIFNARQGVWMGWERKRGKLLDLNKILLHDYDSFPIKAGPLEVLEHVRYVITLDSDTQLPRTAAAAMIGTIAHPLNQAIINPRLRIVTAGYGILQPRVGISVASAARSRLASLYSGETGFDIYTRAVSDVYQDLFGEGIFTGKGIYEASVLHEVLNHRFPRNALLSHDLIEGAYVRAGLVTDIEVIDDYPSHYSAHTRRKHRWVRGDWQIAQWLFQLVPDESGHRVQNPISTISRWKILDNLRRSLVEPLTFLVLVLGWFILPGGAIYWTAATFTILLLPALFQLIFDLSRALIKLSFVAVRASLSTFIAAAGLALLDLTFLPHDTFLSLDAIVRSLIRKFVSGKRLLEWETAAQAESGSSSTTLDIYLQRSPLVALVIALALAFTHARSLFAAAPVLILWAFAPQVAVWLDSSPGKVEGPLAASDRAFLQQHALHLWRYFSEFGGEKNHWLIPDNVEEKDTFQVRTLSPTNLGMLLNARQAAYEFGYLTLPEFAQATLGTLTTYDRLEKQHGHIYNWYNIESLQPIPPLTISSVDSGNLAAALYTLHAGALDLLKRPLLHADLFPHLEPKPHAGRKAHRNVHSMPNDDRAAAMRLRVLSHMQQAETLSPDREQNGHTAVPEDTDWTASEAARRYQALSYFLHGYTPWLLPQFSPLFELPQLSSAGDQQVPALQDATAYLHELDTRLTEAILALPETSSSLPALATELRSLLSAAGNRLAQLKSDIATIASEAERHADAMDFGFLLVESRQLLSIGYDSVNGELYPACYDLLASEARIASLLAVAKGDIPQQSWFRLDRSHVLVDDRPALLSWTGSMFEYMMPALWLRTYPDTLISRTLESVVHIQRDHVRNMPWGISESGYAKQDDQGRYAYQAWGIPGLALKYGAEDGPVISPYSTFLALPLLRKDAIANLRLMSGMGWMGAYGLYEAADYTQGNPPVLVRSWMAHHQGMSLLALTNLLKDNIVQNWFHANPRVRAVELLLHEKPISDETLKALSNRSKLREPEPDYAEAEAAPLGAA